jgi:hypothetical protein
VSSFARRRFREELVPGLLAGLGGLLGLVLGALCLVLLSAPPPLLRPAEGLALLLRVILVVPLPAVLGGRVGLRVGEQVLRRVG